MVPLITRVRVINISGFSGTVVAGMYSSIVPLIGGTLTCTWFLLFVSLTGMLHYFTFIFRDYRVPLFLCFFLSDRISYDSSVLFDFVIVS